MEQEILEDFVENTVGKYSTYHGGNARKELSITEIFQIALFLKDKKYVNDLSIKTLLDFSRSNKVSEAIVKINTEFDKTLTAHEFGDCLEKLRFITEDAFEKTRSTYLTLHKNLKELTLIFNRYEENTKYITEPIVKRLAQECNIMQKELETLFDKNLFDNLYTFQIQTEEKHPSKLQEVLRNVVTLADEQQYRKEKDSLLDALGKSTLDTKIIQRRLHKLLKSTLVHRKNSAKILFNGLKLLIEKMQEHTGDQKRKALDELKEIFGVPLQPKDTKRGAGNTLYSDNALDDTSKDFLDSLDTELNLDIIITMLADISIKTADMVNSNTKHKTKLLGTVRHEMDEALNYLNEIAIQLMECKKANNWSDLALHRMYNNCKEVFEKMLASHKDVKYFQEVVRILQDADQAFLDIQGNIASSQLIKGGHDKSLSSQLIDDEDSDILVIEELVKITARLRNAILRLGYETNKEMAHELGAKFPMKDYLSGVSNTYLRDLRNKCEEKLNELLKVCRSESQTISLEVLSSDGQPSESIESQDINPEKFLEEYARECKNLIYLMEIVETYICTAAENITDGNFSSLDFEKILDELTPEMVNGDENVADLRFAHQDVDYKLQDGYKPIFGGDRTSSNIGDTKDHLDVFDGFYKSIANKLGQGLSFGNSDDSGKVTSKNMEAAKKYINSIVNLFMLVGQQEYKNSEMDITREKIAGLCIEIYAWSHFAVDYKSSPAAARPPLADLGADATVQIWLTKPALTKQVGENEQFFEKMFKETIYAMVEHTRNTISMNRIFLREFNDMEDMRILIGAGGSNDTLEPFAKKVIKPHTNKFENFFFVDVTIRLILLVEYYIEFKPIKSVKFETSDELVSIIRAIIKHSDDYTQESIENILRKVQQYVQQYPDQNIFTDAVKRFNQKIMYLMSGDSNDSGVSSGKVPKFVFNWKESDDIGKRGSDWLDDDSLQELETYKEDPQVQEEKRSIGNVLGDIVKDLYEITTTTKTQQEISQITKYLDEEFERNEYPHSLPQQASFIHRALTNLKQNQLDTDKLEQHETKNLQKTLSDQYNILLDAIKANITNASNQSEVEYREFMGELMSSFGDRVELSVDDDGNPKVTIHPPKTDEDGLIVRGGAVPIDGKIDEARIEFYSDVSSFLNSTPKSVGESLKYMEGYSGMSYYELFFHSLYSKQIESYGGDESQAEQPNPFATANSNASTQQEANNEPHIDCYNSAVVELAEHVEEFADANNSTGAKYSEYVETIITDTKNVLASLSNKEPNVENLDIIGKMCGSTNQQHDLFLGSPFSGDVQFSVEEGNKFDGKFVEVLRRSRGLDIIVPVVQADDSAGVQLAINPAYIKVDDINKYAGDNKDMLRANSSADISTRAFMNAKTETKTALTINNDILPDQYTAEARQLDGNNNVEFQISAGGGGCIVDSDLILNSCIGNFYCPVFENSHLEITPSQISPSVPGIGSYIRSDDLSEFFIELHGDPAHSGDLLQDCAICADNSTNNIQELNELFPEDGDQNGNEGACDYNVSLNIIKTHNNVELNKQRNHLGSISIAELFRNEPAQKIFNNVQQNLNIGVLPVLTIEINKYNDGVYSEKPPDSKKGKNIDAGVVKNIFTVCGIDYDSISDKLDRKNDDIAVHKTFMEKFTAGDHILKWVVLAYSDEVVVHIVACDNQKSQGANPDEIVDIPLMIYPIDISEKRLNQYKTARTTVNSHSTMIELAESLAYEAFSKSSDECKTLCSSLGWCGSAVSGNDIMWILTYFKLMKWHLPKQFNNFEKLGSGKHSTHNFFGGAGPLTYLNEGALHSDRGEIIAFNNHLSIFLRRIKIVGIRRVGGKPNDSGQSASFWLLDPFIEKIYYLIQDMHQYENDLSIGITVSDEELDGSDTQERDLINPDNLRRLIDLVREYQTTDNDRKSRHMLVEQIPIYLLEAQYSSTAAAIIQFMWKLEFLSQQISNKVKFYKNLYKNHIEVLTDHEKKFYDIDLEHLRDIIRLNNYIGTIVKHLGMRCEDLRQYVPSLFSTQKSEEKTLLSNIYWMLTGNGEQTEVCLFRSRYLYEKLYHNRSIIQYLKNNTYFPSDHKIEVLESIEQNAWHLWTLTNYLENIGIRHLDNVVVYNERPGYMTSSSQNNVFINKLQKSRDYVMEVGLNINNTDPAAIKYKELNFAVHVQREGENGSPDILLQNLSDLMVLPISLLPLREHVPLLYSKANCEILCNAHGDKFAGTPFLYGLYKIQVLAVLESLLVIEKYDNNETNDALEKIIEQVLQRFEEHN